MNLYEEWKYTNGKAEWFKYLNQEEPENIKAVLEQDIPKNQDIIGRNKDTEERNSCKKTCWWAATTTLKL